MRHQRRPSVQFAVAGLVALSMSVLMAQDKDQRPVFRGGTNLVLVDAYPRTKDGHIVEGLKPSDFQVTEDGKLQAIDQFEFVRIEPVPEDERIDPNTQDEMVKLAADPHNRVFVVDLDSYHVTRQAARAAKWPLVNMLNRVLGKGDLVGVTTPRVRPKDLVLGRKLVSVEDQLSADWGERDNMNARSEEEALFDGCFGIDQANDGSAVRDMRSILLDRWREDQTLQHLKGLITQIGEMREARTIVMVVTEGWRLYKEDHTLAAHAGSAGSGPPPVGVPPGGGPIQILNRGGNGLPTSGKCNAEILRLSSLDDERVFLDIVNLANRNNIVFYPLSPGGLAVTDSHPDEFVGGGVEGMLADLDHARARSDAAFTLANETGGVAIFDRREFQTGLQRIINDVSAYYLLGYYSTNQAADGKLRRIKVNVNQKNVTVAARKGYVVPTAAAVAAKAAAKAAVPPGPVVPPEVTTALNSLSRIGTNSGLFVAAGAGHEELDVVAELDSAAVTAGKWKNGGDVSVSVTGPDGAAGTGSARIEAGARSALVRVPVSGGGPFRVTVKVADSDATIDEAVDVRDVSPRLLGAPIVYRGASAGRVALKPVADFVFQRTERVHIEFALSGPLDQREARLLDLKGRPVPVPPTVTEREEDGHTILAVDLGLAPLSGGDFVIEVSGMRGAVTEKRDVAIRLVR